MQDQFKKDMADGKIFGDIESPQSTIDDSVEFTPEQIERLYAGKDPFGDEHQEDGI